MIDTVQQVKWTLPFTQSGEYELFAAYDDKKDPYYIYEHEKFLI